MLELLAALRTAGPRSLRFTELQTTVGVCPRTLSLRLRTLVEAGFLTRHAYRETPPRVEYQPTARLEQLNEVFALLESWSRTNSLHVTPIVSTLGKVESAVTSRNG